MRVTTGRRWAGGCKGKRVGWWLQEAEGGPHAHWPQSAAANIVWTPNLDQWKKLGQL